MSKQVFRPARLIAVAAVWLVVAGFAYGQSNDIIDAVLEEEEISYGNAAYLVLVASERLAESASPEDAVSELEELGFGIANRGAGDSLTFGEYSYLLMESLDFSGGLMYRLVPGPRYAARDVAALGIAQGYTLTGMEISGERALRMLGRALAYRDGERL